MEKDFFLHKCYTRRQYVKLNMGVVMYVIALGVVSSNPSGIQLHRISGTMKGCSQLYTQNSFPYKHTCDMSADCRLIRM